MGLKILSCDLALFVVLEVINVACYIELLTWLLTYLSKMDLDGKLTDLPDAVHKKKKLYLPHQAILQLLLKL